LIVTPHENEWLDIPLVHPRFHERIATYKGARRIYVREPEDFIDVCNLFKHGLLIADDCRVYVEDHISRKLKAMLISCRQDDRDLIAVGHGFTDIPPRFFTYATHFVIFATTDNVSSRRNVVCNYAAVLDAVQRVNQKAIEEPHYYEIVKNE